MKLLLLCLIGVSFTQSMCTILGKILSTTALNIAFSIYLDIKSDIQHSAFKITCGTQRLSIRLGCYLCKNSRCASLKCYRVDIQGHPSGWLQPPVDLGLGSSGSWWAATVATNCHTLSMVTVGHRDTFDINVPPFILKF